MLTPANNQVRKELVALYYGQGSEGQAMHLLHQGMAVSPGYADFRLMASRIYLGSGDMQQAYDVLNNLSPSLAHNIDYYATLAALAQKLKHYSQAQQIYQNLLQLHSKEGRWWLGLGIALDKEGQGRRALEAYQHASRSAGLTGPSRSYLDQRIAQLEKNYDSTPAKKATR
ncbi:tetratricopeptide repeat protein [Dongshaea marina]|uniref:tetratricopeptide repeat protein n=1 Tax=Dongshaea marina TaxID=2047966 RepID=UPI000D3E6DD1|nr:tetratricopeptide repeat protein [Dongshaea marina]